jgi:phosphoglucomutase
VPAPVCSGPGNSSTRPSDTEDIYKIYAESFIYAEGFRGWGHLKEILREAQATVDEVLGSANGTGGTR